jgi:hypothetical protein
MPIWRVLAARNHSAPWVGIHPDMIGIDSGVQVGIHPDVSGIHSGVQVGI